MAEARKILANEYGMSDNPDVLLGFAASLFSQYRYADCFAITSRFRFSVSCSSFQLTEVSVSRILEKTKIHSQTLSLHIACMQFLPNQQSKLFLLAHELMQKEPELPISSYAVAAWYIFTKKYSLARRWIRYTNRFSISLSGMPNVLGFTTQ
jgi:anaphase-promoting complex subunit 6